MIHRAVPLLLGAVLCAAPALSAQPAGFSTIDGIVQQMTNAANAHPSICQLVNLTQKYGTSQSWQGRDTYAVKISDNVAVDEDEESVMIVAAHHGNEYGTPIVALDAIARLTEGYATDPQIQRLVDEHEIWIAPVWNVDGYWTSRNNRRPGGSVDLNRNYPFLWGSPCNTGTKGPAPGSEPETQTMMAWSEDQRFTKVLDFHSSGRETLYAYRQSCPNHQLTAYLRSEATALSTASSYGGRVRGPSSNGEHYHWQLGNFSNLAFLTEISNTQSPSITSAQAEADRLWPGTVWFMDRPVPVWGHVTDATSGAPIEANISYLENPFTQGERNRSEPRFGRYHAFLPNGTHTLRVAHPCYVTQDVRVSVTSAGVQVEIALVRAPGFVQASAVARNGSGVNPTCLSSAGAPNLGQAWDLVVDPAGFAAQQVAVISTLQGATGPVLGFGELLLDVQTPQVFALVGPTRGAAVTLSVAVPNNTALLGLTGSVQGVVATEVSLLSLCNAIDYTIGC